MSGGPNRGRGARGGPRGRGKSPFRGRGRGRGRGGPGGGGYHTLNDMDEVFLMADNNQFSSGTASPRGRGRGRGSNPNTPRGRGRGKGGFNDYGSPRGRGGFNDYGSPRGRGDYGLSRGHAGIGDNSPRGRGKGRGGSKLRPDAPLSDLLFHERPLLRPIIFVPSVHTKTLFQEEEEILQAVVEEVGEEEQSHVPTADRVFRVFSGANIPRMHSEDEGDEDELEEIDFNDMAKLMETPARPQKTKVEAVEEKFLGILPGTKPTPAEVMDVDPVIAANADQVLQAPSVDIVIDDNDIPPSQLPKELDSLEDSSILITNDAHDITSESQPELLAQEESDSIIVVNNDVAPQQPLSATQTEELTGFYIDTNPTPVDHPAASTADQASEIIVDPLVLDSPVAELSRAVSEISIEDNVSPAPVAAAPPEAFEGFYIDTQPSHIDAPHQGKPQILEDDDDDDEIIVYVAPHPGRVTPPPVASSSSSAPFLPSTSILTGTTTLASTSQRSPPASGSGSTTPIPPPRSQQAPAPVFDSISFSFTPTPKKAREFSKRSKSKAHIKQRRQEAHATRRRLERQVLFGSFGAMMEEAKLRGVGYERDPRWDERRRGDSDVEWGDEDEDEEGDGGMGVAEGMQLDPELEIDGDAMRRFAKSMSAEGSRFVTMDDIADGVVMRLEDESGDEDGRDVGSSGEDEEDETTEDEKEIDEIVRAEERMLIAEPGDVEMEDSDESEEDSDEVDTSPRTGFQARLERLRKRTNEKGKMRAMMQEASDDEDDEEDYFDRAEEDEDFIEEIQMILEENEDILYGKDRKARNRLFRAVRNGAFEDLDDFKPARKNKDKYKDLPPDLQEQWKKDRDKKAEHKRLRALKRLELAADPMSFNKGGKKGRKAMLAAAKLDPTITVLPNRVIDMTTLVQQIRRFVGDIDGPLTMSLPPTTKETRKNIHEMALAFNLKSVSKGKGDARYTSLTKTTRTGLFVDEKKVAKIVRRSGGGGGGGGGGEFMGSNTRGSRGGGQVVPRHREGEEVGKAAPKIGESNIGFKMLALMGWSEGQRIGMTGGLEAPLTAVIKNTKLGLGATR